jgi:AraC family transcriptional regulator of adaptative response / DNA-3-methyladenine glycosylase II
VQDRGVRADLYPGVDETQGLDFERCYRAVQGCDARFDGRFVTCVTSTGIYCRPSCPALTPKRANVRFLPSAAAAQQAGFRACLRCRPDAVPGDPQWSYRADVTGRAMRLIADGIVDRDGVSGLASRIGYTPRHLGRLLVAEVGAGPLALARAQRAQTARVLIETTTMEFAEIAFAAGFGSIRQFNDTMRQTYGRAPSQLRSGRPGEHLDAAGPGLGAIVLRLPYREPLHAAALLDFLAARAIPGVDDLAGGPDGHGWGRCRYRRGLRLPHGTAQVDLAVRPGHVEAVLHLADLRDLAPAVARCRRLLDLDADPAAVDAVLSADPALAPSVAKEPGVRVPGAVDGFEIAIRAVVGQQVSVAGARSVLGRLVAGCAGAAKIQLRGQDSEFSGESDRSARTPAGFPGADEVAAAPDEAFGMPAARRRTIRALAAAVAEGRLCLDPGADRDETHARLLEIPGVGPWTAQYVALRALGDPDVLMPTDLGVRRGATAMGLPSDPGELAGHGQRHWSPWRSYATVRLWREGAGQSRQTQLRRSARERSTQ